MYSNTYKTYSGLHNKTPAVLRGCFLNSSFEPFPPVYKDFNDVNVLNLVPDLETLDDAIGLHGGEDDVHQPETEKQRCGQDFGSPRATKFPPDLGPAAVHEDGDTDEGKDGEKGDGERQRAGLHAEVLALCLVVYGSDGPGHSDAQKDVHSIAARHIADGGVSVLILGGCHFTSECV